MADTKRYKKRMILYIVAILVSLSVIWLGIQLFLYFNPSILIKKSIGKAEDFYSEMPVVFIEKESVFGTAKAKKAQVTEFAKVIKEWESRLGLEYGKPMDVHYTIRNEAGSMLVLFTGSAADANGEPIEVEEQIEFDFVFDFEK